jgi:hypothetical protein
LCYVKDNMFPGGRSIATYKDEFAFLYDWTASQIDPNTGPIQLPGFYQWFNVVIDGNGTIISGKTDEAIYSEGEKLQEYVYFADDYTVEEIQLTAEARSREWSGWTQVSKASSAKGVVAQPMSQFGNNNNSKQGGPARGSLHASDVRAVAKQSSMSQFGNNNNNSISQSIHQSGPAQYNVNLNQTKTGSETSLITPEVKAMLQQKVDEYDDSVKDKDLSINSASSVVEAPGNNSNMSQEEFDFFYGAFPRRDTTRSVVPKKSISDNSNKLSGPKLASPPTTPDKGPKSKKRRTKTNSPLTSANTGNLFDDFNGVSSNMRISHGPAVSSSLQSFNADNYSWDSQNRDHSLSSLSQIYRRRLKPSAKSSANENSSPLGFSDAAMMVSALDNPKLSAQVDQFQPGIYGSTHLSPFTTPSPSPPLSQEYNTIHVSPYSLNAPHHIQLGLKPTSKTSKLKTTQTGKVKKSNYTLTEADFEKFKKEYRKGKESRKSTPRKQLPRGESNEKQDDDWLSNLLDSIGGKRRTMKAKKYLKNNRKKTLRKTLRKNNKKTLRKTIRKNKKTRKSKH